MFWGRKDAFPGADGSTITQETDNNAQTIPIYGDSGNTLTEGSTTGFRLMNITTEGVLSENTSQVYAIKNPLTFIYNTKAPGDWYTNSSTYQNNNLWSSIKSTYDPCPQGWQVQTDNIWGDFSTSNTSLYIHGALSEPGSYENYYQTSGRLYNTLAWYSFSGYRNNLSGSLGAVGMGSCYWSSTIVDGKDTRYTDITINYVRPSRLLQRAYGISVRCIQE